MRRFAKTIAEWLTTGARLSPFRSRAVTTSPRAIPESNPFYSFTNYDLRHFIAHLEAAGHIDDLHRVLAIETEERKNAWFEAKEANGDASGFLEDVALAWRLAEKTYRDDESTESRGRCLGLQFRYAIINASINSLASNLPADLIVALVEKGIWQPSEGLTLAGRINLHGERAKALGKLAQYVSASDRASILSAALRAARQAPSGDAHLRILIQLFPHLPESLLDELPYDVSLAHNKGISYSDLRTEILRLLAKSGDPRRAIAAIGKLRQSYPRMQALLDLAPDLPQALMHEALATVRRIRDKSDKVNALVRFIPYLQGEDRELALHDALMTARTISDKFQRVRALMRLAAFLSGTPRFDIFHDALLLARENDYEIDTATLLEEMAANLPDTLLSEALKVAYTIKDDYHRVRALRKMAPRLPETTRGKTFPEMRLAAQRIKKHEDRDSVLAWIASGLAESNDPQAALSIVLEINGEQVRADNLQKLARLLAESLLQTAVSAARKIRNPEYRFDTLIELVFHMTQPTRRRVMGEAFAALKEIKYDDTRLKMMRKLISRLPESWPDVLAAAQQLQDRYYRAQALLGLITYLPKHSHGEILAKALASARAIEDQSKRADLLLDIVANSQEPRRSEILLEILSIASTSEVEIRRADMLPKLVPYVPGPLLLHTLASARRVDDDTECLQSLVRLIPVGAQPFYIAILQEALTTAYRIEEDRDRAKSLVEIAMRFAEPKRHQVLQEVLKACGTMHENLRSGTMSYLCEVIADYGFAADALLLAQAIDKPYERVDMLIELAPLLSEPLHSQVLHEIHSVAREVDASWLAKLALQLVGLGRSAEALAVASEIRPADTRAEVLTELIPRLSEPWRSDAIPDALAAIQKMRSQRRRVAAMYTALAPHLLPTSLQIAFSVTREVKSAADRAKLLTNLALQVPQPLRGEVLDAALASAREVKGESPLAEALANLIPQLSEPKCSDVLREALAAALKTKMIEKRVPVLLKLLPYLSEPSREETLRHILELAPKLKAGNRVDTLVELSIYLQEPLLSKILQDALATVREIRDGHNGHRGTALTALVPRLPERYWPAALTAALEIDNVDDRGEAIVNLTRQLMERLQPNTFFPLWCHIVQDMASRTRGGLLSIAQASRPVIVELGGERAVEDIIQATQDVRRWWR